MAAANFIDTAVLSDLNLDCQMLALRGGKRLLLLLLLIIQ